MQKMVLLMLANRTNHETGLCIPKIKTLAEECGMSETACKNAIKALEAAGCIEITQRFQDGMQRPNQYHLLMHARRETPTARRETTQGGSPDAWGVGRQTPTERGSINQEVNQSMSGKPDPVDKSKDEKAEQNAQAGAIEIVRTLNILADKHYKPVPSTLKLIRARMKEYTLLEIAEVVERKCKEWKGTKMEQYLRPETLFNATKFAGYAGQRGIELRQDSNGDAEGSARWWESSAAISQMGGKLGVTARTTEAFWQYKCRVAKASKQREAMDAILADMIRTGNAAYEETARYFGVAVDGSSS